MSEIKNAWDGPIFEGSDMLSENGHVGAALNDGGDLRVSATSDSGWHLTPQDRHALAALCLHKQPFGFTSDDVVALQDLAAFVVNDSEYRKQALSLAARIAALLPPENT